MATDGPTLRDLVRAVDGLPLALEIVAPWLRALGPAGLLGELHNLLDLTARRSDAEHRHRTLRSTIAWSHDRLSRTEQRLLRRMSVLRGGGDLDAVRAVAGDDLGGPVLDVLVDLIERNLVKRTEAVADIPRFRLLETVRQFAAERLDEAGETRAADRRMAEHFATWAVELARHSEGAGSEPWIDRAVADADNLRAAMEALDRAGRADAHLDLVVNAIALWLDAGHESEGERRLERALAAAAPDAQARAPGLTYLSWLVGPHDLGRAYRLADEAARLARERGEDDVLAMTLMWLGDIAPDREVARAASEESVDVAHRLRGSAVRYAGATPDVVVSEAATNLAALARDRFLPAAIEWQLRAVDVAGSSGGQRLVASHLSELSDLYLLAGDVDSAGRAISRAGALLEGAPPARVSDRVAVGRARLLLRTGRTDEAAATARTVIASGLAAGRPLHVYRAACVLADVLLDGGDTVAADAALRTAESTLDEGTDLRFTTAVQVRRARLLRLLGRRDAARSMLEAAEKGLDPDGLSLERITWLVEHALLATDAAEEQRWVDRLEELSRRTGVHVPPWERRQLARLDGRADQPPG